MLNLVIIAFIFSQTVSSQFANIDDLICPGTTRCSSVLHNNAIKISCPQLSISIYWTQSADLPSIDINCFDLDEFYLSLYEIPICQYRNMSVEKFDTVHISGCPLPTEHSIKLSFKIFENSSVNSLEWYSPSVFNRQHFNGFEDLEQMNLKENGLTELPEDLFNDLTNLRMLDLTSNKLNLTMNIFANLKKLEFLKLGHNNLKMLEEGVFKNQNKLKILDLRSNNLKNLTKGSLDGLSSLRHLDLSLNQIETFQSDIFSKLIRLDDLRLNENHFKSLPEKLFKYNKELISLTMKENRIPMEKLPSGFLTNLNKLKSVTISCGLSTLQDDLFKGLENLSYITFDYNNLTTVPVNLFADQRNLHELNLNHNQLSYLPNGLLAHSNALTELKLSNNQLVEFSGLIFNPLENYDKFYSKDHILHIDLSYNKLKKLSSSFQTQFYQPVSVDLSNNEIFEVDFNELEILAMNERELTVYMENNPIYCNCDILHFNKFLRSELAAPNTNRLFEIIPGDLRCAGPENLDGKLVIDIKPIELLCPLDSPQSLDRKCPVKCSCMIRPEDQTLLVDCSNADLHQIPDLPNLILQKFESTEMNISFNHIEDLPIISLNNYSNLKEIHAQNNSITKILDENIPDQLRVLDLSNNNLKEMNLTIFEKFNKTQDLKVLKLSGNPWKCSCENLELLSFVQENVKLIKDFNEVRCSNGEIIFKLTESDFCSLKSYLIVAAVIIIVLLIGIILTVYYQKEIKEWFFEHNMTCFWSSITEDDKRFDAFISYSYLDEGFVNDHLVPELENGSKPFRLCIHHRDWAVGDSIQEQIVTSVENSRRTIIIMTKNFLKSDWGQFEFRVAHRKQLEEGINRVIVIIYEDIENNEILDDEFKAYLNACIHIKWGDKLFWNKLRYAIKRKNLINSRRAKVVGQKDNMIEQFELNRRNQLMVA